MKTTKLADYLLQQSLKLSLISQFEPKHRAFLQSHETAYFVNDGRVCFMDSALLDAIAYFGAPGWKVNNSEFVKEVDGVEIKLFRDEESEGLVTITPKKPFLPAQLDVIGGDTCKIGLPMVPTTFGNN